MKLLIILLVLATIHYLNIFGTPARYSWFIQYARLMQGWCRHLGSAWISSLVILVPIMTALWFLHKAVIGWGWNIPHIVTSYLILWYCLWPVSLEKWLETSISAQANHQDTSGSSRLLSSGLLCRAHQEIFAVLFWFIALGTFGALLYRCAELLANRSQQDQGNLRLLQSAATTIHALLDWIPARLTALTYVLAGDFVPGFTQWRNLFWTGYVLNDVVLVKTGLAAGGFDVDNSSRANSEESRSLLRMIDRTVIVWIVIYAIIALGIIIY